MSKGAPAQWTPPPNWPPAEPGWQPPPGWQPDPAWGPAPEGWNFYPKPWTKMNAAEKKAADPDKAKGETRKGLAVLAGIAVLVAGCVAVTGGGDDEDTGAAAPAAQESQSAEEQAAEARRLAENQAAAEQAERDRVAAEAAAALPPNPADFTIAIDVLEKQCFGSAGCNVTFRINPSYAGAADATDVEVTYEVRGGEDPKINTFTIDGAGTASFDSEERISTASSTAELTAVVTAVRRS